MSYSLLFHTNLLRSHFLCRQDLFLVKAAYPYYHKQQSIVQKKATTYKTKQVSVENKANTLKIEEIIVRVTKPLWPKR